MEHLSAEKAGKFYAVHKERPFYNDLVEFMTSGPVMVQVLEGEDAIAKNREVMGATNPVDAAPGTIRADFAQTVDENAVHGSDGTDTASVEIEFFFGLFRVMASSCFCRSGTGLYKIRSLLTLSQDLCPPGWQVGKRVEQGVRFYRAA
jgi:nucleoside diphosphate kinase